MKVLFFKVRMIKTFFENYKTRKQLKKLQTENNFTS